MDHVRIGILGAGRGLSMARAFRYAPTAELAAICDADEERLARAVSETNVGTTFTRYEDLLDTDVDAVIVASPMPLHVEHSVAALNARKHVLSEVTAATTIEQCWQLLEAAKASSAKYMFGENYCYTRFWSVVVGMVQAGVFGDLYYGEADQIQEFKGGFRPGTWRTAELAMRRGHQYITHNLGPLYQVFGERIKTVSCMGSGQHHLDWAKADDTCVVLLQTVTGKLLRIRLDFFSDRPTSFTYLGLQGTGACYEGTHTAQDDHRVYVHGQTEPGTWQSLWDFSDYLPEGWKRMPEEAIDRGYDGGTSVMIEDFAQCIQNDTRPPLDVVDALNMTAPGLLSEVSRERGGEPVEVPEFR